MNKIVNSVVEYTVETKKLEPTDKVQFRTFG